MRSLNIGATGMLAQQLNVEVISNNIANLNTTAYQRRRAEFQDLLYQNQRRVGSSSSDSGTIVPAGVNIGLGVKPAAVYRITDPGNLALTKNSLDLAINGKGYFQINMPNGEIGYTRAGSFQLDQNGSMVTIDGYALTPSITIPNGAIDVTINDNGEVMAKLDGQVNLSNLGQIQLARFANEVGLQAVGDNLHLETEASGGPTTAAPGSIGFGKTKQNYLETSNVNVVEEITNLITAQRAYEMNSKVIETSDQMMSTVTQIR